MIRNRALDVRLELADPRERRMYESLKRMELAFEFVGG